MLNIFNKMNLLILKIIIKNINLFYFYIKILNIYNKFDYYFFILEKKYIIITKI